MSETKIRVLVVDDDQDQLALAERTLSAHGFDVRTHRSSLGGPTWCAPRRRIWCCWT
jgi:DNA-binding NtrC family response regulator